METWDNAYDSWSLMSSLWAIAWPSLDSKVDLRCPINLACPARLIFLAWIKIFSPLKLLKFSKGKLPQAELVQSAFLDLKDCSTRLYSFAKADCLFEVDYVLSIVRLVVIDVLRFKLMC